MTPSDLRDAADFLDPCDEGGIIENDRAKEIAASFRAAADSMERPPAAPTSSILRRITRRVFMAIGWSTQYHVAYTIKHPKGQMIGCFSVCVSPWFHADNYDGIKQIARDEVQAGEGHVVVITAVNRI